MASVAIPSKTQQSSSLRRYSYSSTQVPPLPPRRHSVANPLPNTVKLKAVAQAQLQSGNMDSRYYRPSSPRGRITNPNRSSTGTFADPYYDSAYYGRTSPRTSGERIGGTSHAAYTYAPSSSSGSRSANLKYDSYSGRPRRNTLTEDDARLVRPAARDLPPTTALPIRAPAVHSHHHHLERPSSPLTKSWDSRGDTYITGPAKREHKRIYSVDDNSHKANLVAERDVIEPRRREEPRGYSTTSGGRSYHDSKPSRGRADIADDDGYSYTDARAMYNETEPAWRPRPRTGSIERGSRPTSMILDSGPRSSARELGPPPSTRGFDRINGSGSGLGRSGSLRHRERVPSLERAKEIPKYDPYPDAAPARSSSTRHKPATVHQEPREPRRDTYHDEYDRRERVPDRRQNTADRFEDRQVETRGFGIAAVPTSLASEQTALDRQPIWNAQEMGRARPEEYGAQYYEPSRSDARMPEPPRVPRDRDPRDRDVAPVYEERPRERERDRRDRDVDDRDRGHLAAIAPIAGVATGAAATLAAAEALKSRRDGDRDRDRDRERDRDSDQERERKKEREREREREKEREKRREHDERDRRDRVADEGRRDSREERRERAPLPPPPPPPPPAEIIAPAAAAYASVQEPDRKPRERRYEDDDGERKQRERRYEEEPRDRKPRKAPSDDSGDDRPHHYADREEARINERRRDAPKEAELDPDEEYRRRVQQEMERSGRSRPDQELTADDRERERRRRKEERAKSRDRSLGPSDRAREDPPHPRYDERSNSAYDAPVTQEPESLDNIPREERDSAGKSVQIVEPAKEEPKPKGILRKPTEKFPEHPDSIREGVAPHKSALKGKDIPVGARWTKIDRRLVNPEALEEAKERFEERMDCVIVLRVLTKSEIQKLADRTKEIRAGREDEHEHRDHKDRDRRDDRDRDRDRDRDDDDRERRRRHRSHRDDEDRDRDRRREYSDTDEESLRDRDRDRERDRPRELEGAR